MPLRTDDNACMSKKKNRLSWHGVVTWHIMAGGVAWLEKGGGRGMGQAVEALSGL